jgi:hypothetical protein
MSFLEGAIAVVMLTSWSSHYSCGNRFLRLTIALRWKYFIEEKGTGLFLLNLFILLFYVWIQFKPAVLSIFNMITKV